MGILQWGHHLSAVETCCSPVSVCRCTSTFNGATTFRQWKPSGSLLTLSVGTAFNGATTFRQWKHDHRRRKGSAVLLPSMGPPPFGSGNVGLWRSSACWALSLQWGHHLSAVETALPYGLDAVTIYPSMGPPPFGSGNSDVAEGIHIRIHPSMGPPPFGSGNDVSGGPWSGQYRPSMGPPPFGSGNGPDQPQNGAESGYLQWGHHLSAVETRWPTLPHGFMNRLQWGHHLSAVETPYGVPEDSSRLDSFNGATTFRQWKRAQHLDVPAISSSFNGATTFRQWKQAIQG